MHEINRRGRKILIWLNWFSFRQPLVGVVFCPVEWLEIVSNVVNKKVRLVIMCWKYLWSRKFGIFTRTWLRYVRVFAIANSFVVCNVPVPYSLYSGVETFGNISSTFCTLAILWHSHNILRRVSQGNPSVGGVKHKRGIKVERCRVRISHLLVGFLLTVHEICTVFQHANVNKFTAVDLPLVHCTIDALYVVSQCYYRP